MSKVCAKCSRKLGMVENYGNDDNPLCFECSQSAKRCDRCGVLIPGGDHSASHCSKCQNELMKLERMSSNSSFSMSSGSMSTMVEEKTLTCVECRSEYAESQNAGTSENPLCASCYSKIAAAHGTPKIQNFQTPQQLSEEKQKALDALAESTPADSGFFAPERRGIQKGVAGGLLMMGIAVVWFIGGYAAGFIFYYPPILFIIGLYALIKGVATGNFSGKKAASESEL